MICKKLLTGAAIIVLLTGACVNAHGAQNKSVNPLSQLQAGFATYEYRTDRGLKKLRAGVSSILDKEGIVSKQELQSGMMHSVLTNEMVAKELGNQRPVAVMINNNQAACPQAGIAKADIVYESYTEGSITRLLALVQNYKDIPKIGPIRSCRDYYVEWALEWDPVLVHFGGPELYVEKLYQMEELDNLNGIYLDGTVFFRDSSREPAQNAYVSGASVIQGIEHYGYEKQHTDFYQGNHFQFVMPEAVSILPGQGIEAKLIQPGYYTNKPWFTYDEASGLYYRYQYDQPHVDQLTGEQLAYRNIIIQFAKEEKRDEKGYLKIDVIDNSEYGFFITDGRAIPLSWEKNTETGITRYFDEAGKEIRLNTGKTWICIVSENEKQNVIIE